MGNLNSQQHSENIITQRSNSLDRDEKWNQKRQSGRTNYHHKLVVPDRNAHQRLRPTDNGEILLSGGTLSGRNQHGYHGNAIIRSSSIPPQKRPQSPVQKFCRPFHRNNYKNISRKEQIKRFDSEPNLHGTAISIIEDNTNYQEKFKGRKKYRAPPPPNLLPIKNEFDNITCSIENASPIRRARLFKTRAETKKKLSSPVNNRRSLNENIDIITPLDQQSKYKSSEAICGELNAQLEKPKPPRIELPYVMQRTRSSPEFQAELREVTKRLINAKNNRVTEPLKNQKPAPKSIESKLKTLDPNISNKEFLRNKLKEMELRTPASGKESTPEQSPPKVKTFYFGMDDTKESKKIPNSIGSDVSSESETEISNDICLQLRPILPKKQPEIPRFSPAAAWKLLSAVDTNPGENLSTNEDSPFFVEDKIEKLARQPPPYRMVPIGPRSSHDKSGDSGISGDETPEAVIPSPKGRGISWTPQQDLGDDSSLEEVSLRDFPLGQNFTPRTHVFSLSLPRDNHLNVLLGEKQMQPYSSLQKTRRSISGFLGVSPNKKEIDMNLDPSENWFLSRSAPNSINNGFNSLEMQKQFLEDADACNIIMSNKRRIMYLPHSNAALIERKKQMSKSYENISADIKFEPESLQDPPKVDQRKWVGSKKNKKFTFQSTVRQIERKRLADKLSKEAERKEKQRLRELEAMQRVEEEFQRKRAREKASIRQQLRLYNLDEMTWTNYDLNEEVRPEPDGAVSSSASSPIFTKNHDTKTQSTQILSEYRHPQRDYKEFRSSVRCSSQFTTVHPKVTCNLPKATENNKAGNYRRDFAHGMKSTNSSISEESSSNLRNQSPIISMKR